MKLKRKKRVLVALHMTGMVSRRKLAGIFRYLEGADHWEIVLLRLVSEFTPEFVGQALSDGLDGAIVSSSNPYAALDVLSRSDIPIVVMELHHPDRWERRKNALVLEYSGAKIGETGAKTLLKSGRCRSFAFLHNSRDMYWAPERLAEFREVLAKSGHDCVELHSPEGIANLARPVGVLAAHDDAGMRAINFCNGVGLKVPDEVQVISIGNDQLICENCRPSLSSIEPDYEQEGFLAARELDRMMASKKDTPRRSMSVGIKEVVLRGSTLQLGSAGALAQNALSYLRRHVFDGIGAEDVARRLNCSRRLVDMRFRESFGKSMGEFLTELRIAEAKRLLAKTECTIAEIAEKCGYASSAYLMTLFRRTTGSTMAEFRRRASPSVRL